LLRLLAALSLFYVEDLLALPLLGLRLTLAFVALLGVSIVALELLGLVLLFQSFAEVVVRSAILLELVVEIFDGSGVFPG
jgi:hypothetical protein